MTSPERSLAERIRDEIADLDRSELMAFAAFLEQIAPESL